MGWSECQDDVHKIESQCMVVKMTVLSVCTEAECGFQSETSTASKVLGALALAAVPAAIGRAVLAGAAALPGAAALAGGAALVGVASLLLGASSSKHPTQASKAKEVDEEAEFKRQFVAHVTKKEQLIIDSTSANCSKQVEQ